MRFGGADMTPYGTEGLYLMTRYAVEVDDAECPILVEIHVAVVDGQPQCVELLCRPRSGGPPVSSESLRQVRLARYVRQSTTLYSVRVEGHGDEEFMQATGTGDELLLARASQSRHEMTDELLREVADVYSGAHGSKPTIAVMRHFDVSRPTAGRWVMEARKRGHLPTLPPKEEKNR
jgi:hypothetical protein